MRSIEKNPKGINSNSYNKKELSKTLCKEEATKSMDLKIKQTK